MSEVSLLLNAARAGDPQAANRLLPLVYDELRGLAKHMLARESPGHTLQPTALVHEAYLRLIGPTDPNRYADQGHFYAAAAQAMRHILVDSARRKLRSKHGGRRARLPIEESTPAPPCPAQALMDLDEALTCLTEHDPEAGAMVQLRYFGGLSVEEAAQSLGMSRASAYRHWTFARAWLLQQLTGGDFS